VDAAERLRGRGIAASFLCAGVGTDDDYERWLKRTVVERGLGSSFHFLGFWEEVSVLLTGSDVTVLPSVDREELSFDGRKLQVSGSEGLPRAILESLACATPVVATRVAGVEEQVEHGRTALLVPPSDPVALADALAQAGQSPRWREAAGAEGREVVGARFSVSEASRGLAEVLRSLPGRPRGIATMGVRALGIGIRG